MPTWYFNLKPGIDHGYFPDPEVIPESLLKFAESLPLSKPARLTACAYMANKSGFIDMQSRPGKKWWKTNISVKDEYAFARSFFHPSRVITAWLLRMLTLHNPVKETIAFFRTLGMRRINFPQPNGLPGSYDQFDSSLLRSLPHVTVIIPTLNRYQYLEDVLHDLENQEYQNFDVVVIDQSDPFDETFYHKFHLNMEVIRQEERALWKARNSAVLKSDSDFLLFYDDDSRVESGWIREHLKCLDFFGADISSGVSISRSGGTVPVNYRVFRWSDQLDTGNAMIRRKVFEKTGLFDRQFEKQRMGDGEFGLRSYLAGFRNISNPLAKRIHLKVGGGGLREMGNWDAFRPKSFWSPRPIPSVLYFYRKYFGTKAAVLSLAINTPPSMVPYRFKKNKKLLVAGSFFFVLLFPFTIFQIILSWIRSGKMLNNPKIECLSEIKNPEITGS